MDDWCDRCGPYVARAVTMAVLGMAEINLCGHHTRVHRAALEAQGWEVWDVSETVDA